MYLNVVFFTYFFNEDAELISENIGLKLVGLNDSDCKCGFPVKTKEKYFKILDDKKILYEIIANEKNNLKCLQKINLK